MTTEPTDKRHEALQALFDCFTPDARSDTFDVDSRRFVSLIIQAAKDEIRLEQKHRRRLRAAEAQLDATLEAAGQEQRAQASQRWQYEVRQLMPGMETHAGAPGRWYVCERSGTLYLHRDGVWRLGVNTYAADDSDEQHPIPTGFYATKADAGAALDAAIAAGVLPR